MPNNITAQENRGAHGYFAPTGKLAGSNANDAARYKANKALVKAAKKELHYDIARDASIKESLAKIRGSVSKGAAKRIKNTPTTLGKNAPTKIRRSKTIMSHADPTRGETWGAGRLPQSGGGGKRSGGAPKAGRSKGK